MVYLSYIIIKSASLFVDYRPDTIISSGTISEFECLWDIFHLKFFKSL